MKQKSHDKIRSHTNNLVKESNISHYAACSINNIEHYVVVVSKMRNKNNISHYVADVNQMCNINNIAH